MGKPQRRRKVHFGDTHLARRWRVRNRKRDLDLVRLDTSYTTINQSKQTHDIGSEHIKLCAMCSE